MCACHLVSGGWLNFSSGSVLACSSFLQGSLTSQKL
ncbi:hypothetical protein [Vibrio phage vB_pir03]|nr:hypothetical protein [Vibrio phage vB_pir03]